MFKKTFLKIKQIIEDDVPGVTIGYAFGIATGCVFLLAFSRKDENDPYYTITKSEFERAAESDECLRIRNDLGQFRFYMDHPA